MRANPHRWSIASILALSTLAPLAGAAEPESPKAREHLERGLRHYEAQAYDRAVAEFQAGYTLEPHRHFLYALGQAERMRGNCKQAIDAYNAFLRQSPPEDEAERASQNIERCEASQAKPAPAPATPKAPPPAEPIRDRPTESGPSTLTYVGFAVAGVGFVTGTVTGILALSHEASAREQCSGNVCRASAQDDINASERFAWISNAAFGVGFVGLVVGFIGLTTSGGASEQTTGVRADVVAASGGFATTLEGRF